ncbi:MAG: FecR family protein [Chlorobi bacterium]|nr:FecR family protein [Chlorobiota bacterium]
MTNKAKIWELITNQLSQNEEEEVLNDIYNSTELQKQYKELLKIWSLSEGNERFSDEEINSRFRNFTYHKDNKRTDIKQLFISTLKYAAVFILALAIGKTFFNKQVKVPGQKVADKKIVFETEERQVAKVTLSDGSVVWLNGNSKIQIPDNPEAQNTRDVYLQGEGFFEVVKDSARPFSVHTEQGPVIKVLGTKFDVDAYSSDKVITTLLEGSVELQNNMNTLAVLKPGDRAVHNIKTGQVEISNSNSKYITLWKEKIFTFKNEEFASIIPKLENFYQVKIVLKNKKLGKQKVSGRAMKNYSIEQVLNAFTMVTNIRYKISIADNGKQTIYIY